MSLALSPTLGGADGFGPLRQLVLDAVSSPLTRVMYARALDDFFGWWSGQGRPAFSRVTVQAWRAALEAQRSRAGEREPETLGGAEAGRGSRL